MRLGLNSSGDSAMTRPMNRLCVLAGITVLLLGSFTPQLARACSCFSPTYAESFLGHSLIFSGTVTHIVPVTSGDWADLLVVVFDKERFWKGKDIGSGAIILTYSDPGVCGYPFQVGEKYLVFANRTWDENAFGAHLCSGTSDYNDNSPVLDFLDTVVSIQENSWGGIKQLYASEDE